MGEILTLIGLVNSLVGIIGRFSEQANSISQLITKLQAEDRSMTEEEWRIVDNVLEEARKYAKTAMPPITHMAEK